MVTPVKDLLLHQDQKRKHLRLNVKNLYQQMLINKKHYQTITEIAG